MDPRNLSKKILVHPVLRAQPDRRLVALAREGNEAAVDEIVRRYRPALKRYAASIVPVDRADDVVQDTLARALSGITAGDAEIHLRPWLYTIARNTAFNELRDAGPPYEQLDENYDGVEQPPQALERREQMRSLFAGLQGLPEAQRQALVKREMEGRSHADIGADLGISVGAARQLIYRARGALREGIGALVPMPLLRELLEGGGTNGVAAAGGGAIAVKATVAVLATGAALTAGRRDREFAPPCPFADCRAARRCGRLRGERISAAVPSPGPTAFTAGKHGGTRTGVNSVQVSDSLGSGPGLTGGGKSATGGHGEVGGVAHQGPGNGHGATGSGDGQGGDSPQGGSGSGDSLSRDNSGGSDSGPQSNEQPSGDGGGSSGDSGSGGGDSGSGGSRDGSGGGETTTTQTGQD